MREGEKSLDGFYRAWHPVEFYRCVFKRCCLTRRDSQVTVDASLTGTSGFSPTAKSSCWQPLTNLWPLFTACVPWIPGAAVFFFFKLGLLTKASVLSVIHLPSKTGRRPCYRLMKTWQMLFLWCVDLNRADMCTLLRCNFHIVMHNAKKGSIDLASHQRWAVCLATPTGRENTLLWCRLVRSDVTPVEIRSATVWFILVSAEWSPLCLDIIVCRRKPMSKPKSLPSSARKKTR